MTPTGPATDLVARLDLEPHPEGGWFRRTWTAATSGADGRGHGSSILYLLDADEVGRWHRVDAEELWVHAGGAPLELRRWAEGDAAVRTEVLGAPGDGAAQAVVAAGEWQQAATSSAGWTLVVCVVVPEFVAEGFELAPDGWAPPVP